MDLDLSRSNTLGSYIPHGMLIRIGKHFPLFCSSGIAVENPIPQAVGVFFHEYVHHLHNISTSVGIASFVNHIELWRSFRETFAPNGDSNGSGNIALDKQEHIGKLFEYFSSSRRYNLPEFQIIQNPTSVEITSCTIQIDVVQNGEVKISMLVCDAVASVRGQDESLKIKIGTSEVLESAAWLLEKKIISTIDPGADAFEAEVFPYKVVSALGEYLFPGASDDCVLACILCSLLSSDAPSVLEQVFGIARRASASGGDPLDALRQAAAIAINEAIPALTLQLENLEREFCNDGVMAKAVRHATALIKTGLTVRQSDPFFELAMIEQMRDGASIEEIIQQVPCYILQEDDGDGEAPKRDFLFSIEESEEAHIEQQGLRILHCIFEYLYSHFIPRGFVETKLARPKQCPFYTCCDLALRKAEPAAACQSHPWKAADWSGWNGEGTCWYGAGVQVTRPPQQIVYQAAECHSPDD